MATPLGLVELGYLPGLALQPAGVTLNSHGCACDGSPARVQTHGEPNILHILHPNSPIHGPGLVNVSWLIAQDRGATMPEVF